MSRNRFTNGQGADNGVRRNICYGEGNAALVAARKGDWSMDRGTQHTQSDNSIVG